MANNVEPRDDQRDVESTGPSAVGASVTEILLREGIPLKGPPVLLQQNKPGGFACVSRSYANPAHPKPFEFCENGAKATINNRQALHAGFLCSAHRF